MKTYWKTLRGRNRALPERRPLSFRATSELIARRKRLRKQIGAALAACIALGLLLAESTLS